MAVIVACFPGNLSAKYLEDFGELVGEALAVRVIDVHDSRGLVVLTYGDGRQNGSLTGVGYHGAEDEVLVFQACEGHRRGGR